MKLEGWKARVVLIAAIIICVDAALVIPVMVVMGYIAAH